METIDVLKGLTKPVKPTIDLYSKWLKADRQNITKLDARIKDIENRVKFDEILSHKGKHFDTFKFQFASYFAKGIAYGLAFAFSVPFFIWFWGFVRGYI